MLMPILKKSTAEPGVYGLFHAFDIRRAVASAGFHWDQRGFWRTENPYAALVFRRLADKDAAADLEAMAAEIRASYAVSSDQSYPCPEGLSYLDFQKAGIQYALRRTSVLFGDEPGLGKTIQVAGLANTAGLKRLLVVCPATLRRNWAYELEKWHMLNPGIDVFESGTSRGSKHSTHIISYDLATKFKPDSTYDMIVLDEAHYLKNSDAKRTKRLLVKSGNNLQPLISYAPRHAVLTGTPMPNRVSEIYTLIRAFAPNAIVQTSAKTFLHYYAQLSSEGQEVGIRHEHELALRLRANFMVRRLKQVVLKELPLKQYRMIVFPAIDSAVKRVLERERPFNPQEIIKNGTPVGTALPEIRREMGVATVPLILTLVKDLLDDGVPKVAVYGYHTEVLEKLTEGLKRYGVVLIYGKTPTKTRMDLAWQFDKDPFIRVFVGQTTAAGTGLNLTACDTIVHAEPSWVPGENDQVTDRFHRIGQTNKVQVLYPVVERSLNAVILSAEARKRDNIIKIIDGGTT